MISCAKISKKYNSLTVFDNFSYIFSDKGLYVLWGESGSGKTTLLNIIMGIEKFHSGSINYDNKTYHEQVSFEDIQSKIAYISQDNYFIDYLTLEDNIKILLDSESNTNDVDILLDKFELKNKKNNYPHELSGGERQRLAIIQTIIKNKKILIIDEPTASLDPINRNKLLQILKELKEQILIICATHDSAFIDISDDVIDLNNKNKYSISASLSTADVSNAPDFTILPSKKKISTLIAYMLQKNKYKNREKKSSIFMIIVIVISFLMAFSTNKFEEKLFDGLVINNKINGVKISCSVDNSNYCDNIIQSSKYENKYRNYEDDIIKFLPKQRVDGGYYDTFELGIVTLPYDIKYLNISKNPMLYGTYFTTDKQLVLGYNKAIQIAYDKGITIQKLVGEPFIVNLPKGDYEFKIAGILKPFDSKDTNYLKAIFGIHENFDNYYFISSFFYDDYYEQYLKEETDDLNEFLFFESSNDLVEFYNKNISSNKLILNDYSEAFNDYKSKIESVSSFIFPMITFLLLFTIIFYYQTRKIEMVYNENELLVYQYYGFSSKKISRAMIICNLIDILKKICIALIITFITEIIANYIILNSNILPFKLFKFDLSFFVLISSTLLVFSTLLVKNVFKKFNKNGWFNFLKERRDLI